MKVILLAIGCLVSCVSNTHYLAKVTKKRVFLGKTPIVIQHENYGPGKIFVHVHANETTALNAARQIARIQGGHVMTLVHEPTRDIRFKYHGKTYTFDPNRIYTPKGIRLTLKAHGCRSDEAEQIISSFAKTILAEIPPGQKVVAVHNNKGYSLLDYLPKHALAHDAQAVFYNKADEYYRNFFLVTKAKEFYRYKISGYNVVQQATHVTDDGSLSVALSNRTYVNVEAGFNQLARQMRMLRVA